MNAYIYIGLPNQVKLRALKAIKDSEFKLTNKVSQSDIINCVCKYYNVDELDIIGKSRKRGVVLPRQIAMYLIYLFVTNSTLKGIGKYFNRDHSTCVYANQTVVDLLATDKEYKREYNQVLRMLSVL